MIRHRVIVAHHENFNHPESTHQPPPPPLPFLRPLFLAELQSTIDKSLLRGIGNRPHV